MRIRRLMVVATGCAAAVGLAAAPAHADTVHTLPGGTWAVLPDTTAGASATIVNGPAVPPVGRGSLRLHVDSDTDRALVGTDLGALTARPWSGLAGSYATYAPVGGPQRATPTMRFAGFQTVTPDPQGFTTLSFEPAHNGTVQLGQWQAWTLGPSSIVWQSNTADGFCVQSVRCTLAEFAARYPQGAWGNAQLGLGTGLPGPAEGFADDVRLTDGTDTLVTDFDPLPLLLPPSQPPAPSPEPSEPVLLPVTGTDDPLLPAAAGAVLTLLGYAMLRGSRRRSIEAYDSRRTRTPGA